MQVRISKAGKFSKQFPKPVAEKIRQIAQGYHKLVSCEIKDVPPSKKFYIGEGERFTGLFPDGRSASFEVVSQNTLGAANVSHRIGEQFQMPAGTYLVRISYYTRYWMEVYRVGPEALPEPGN